MELTKEYFDEQLKNLATKEAMQFLQTEVTEIKTDIATLQDNFRGVKYDLSKIRQTLDKLDKRDQEDSNAFAKTLVDHDERLTTAEQDIKQLKLKHA